jgi:cytochrome c oxidase cbb3-type subunit 4
MDLDTLRTVIEVLAFAAFVGVVAWAWSARRRDDFGRAARIPFDE